MATKLERVVLADGRTVDMGRNEWHRDPYIRGAEAAFWTWREFMRGQRSQPAYKLPSYLLHARNDNEVVSLLAGFDDNIGNNGLIEASR